MTDRQQSVKDPEQLPDITIMLGTLAVLALYRAVEDVRRGVRAGLADQALTDLLALIDSLADDRATLDRRRGNEQHSKVRIDQAG